MLLPLFYSPKPSVQGRILMKLVYCKYNHVRKRYSLVPVNSIFNANIHVALLSNNLCQVDMITVQMFCSPVKSVWLEVSDVILL